MVGIRMFTAGINGAISGFVIGEVIGGLVSAKQGNTFLDGLLEGSVYGLINGFTTSAILFCGSEALKAIVKPSCCFIAGTVVMTEEGNKAIEEIEVGDMVWAYNEETGQKDLKRVLRLFRNETEEWIHINIYKSDEETCEEIVCTPEHPFYIPNIGWVNASNLVENMEVLLYNRNKVNIAKITREVFEKPETTYNFEVEDYHTYYVSDSGVLVHNNCIGDIILYRGGDKMTVRARDVDIIDDLVQPTRGISVNSNPNMATSFGTPHQLGTLPDGLKSVVTSGTHFEIVPTYAMRLDKYQSLLNMIPLKPI